MWWTPWLVCALAIFVGVVLQRVTGLGVGLVAAPVLSLILGPIQGVLIANIATVTASAIILIDVWRFVDGRRTWPILVSTALASLPGAWVVAHVNGAWLQVMLGAMVMVALITSLRMPPVPHSDGHSGPFALGAVAGFFGTAAGIGSPPLAIYAKASDWPQVTFAASMQPIFIVMGSSAVASKFATGVVLQPAPALFWVLTPVLILVGLVVGRPIAERVPSSFARSLALGIAGLGGAVALVKGVLTLVR